MISLLVAMDQKNVIGANNDMPWHLPNDLKFFKQLTTNNTIIMGRKTYESIGKPLPNRENIVLSRSNLDFPDGIKVIDDFDDIIDLAKERPDDELFIIGGGVIFDMALKHAKRLYVTFIDEDFGGDTFFPEISEEKWELLKEEKGPKNNNNPYDYYYRTYELR